jgi:hypothetical protein
MARPTRKQPSDWIGVSPQGVEFLDLVHRLLGPDVAYTAVATFERGRRRIFKLEATRGTALLTEAWEEPDGSEATPRWGFITVRPDGQQVCATLDARRWDAGQYLAVTGTEPFLGVSARRRKELEDQRRAEIGAARDRLVMYPPGSGAAWTNLSGIQRATIEEQLTRHRIGLWVALGTPKPGPLDVTKPPPSGWVDPEVWNLEMVMESSEEAEAKLRGKSRTD